MYHLLITPKTTRKAQSLLKAIHRAAKAINLPITLGPDYRPCQMLLMYGLGGPDRMHIGMRHIQSGKTLVTFDLGYWNRKAAINDRPYRVAIDGFHPRNVMDGPLLTDARWERSGLDIQASCITDGPIMLVGNAPKSVAAGAGDWTAKKSQEIRRVFPGAKILYRPKPKRPYESRVLHDAVSTGQIDDELQRVSLVVCRHSNVAVDACRLGVPVVCDDGAAACIYPQRLQEYKNQPDINRRTEFLHRLAYWQWSANEANQFWDWLFTAFPAYRY